MIIPHRVRVALALSIIFSAPFCPAIGAEWIFAPSEQRALRDISDEALLSKVNAITAAFDYEIKMPIMTHRLSRQGGFELFVACVKARGVDVLRPEQFRVIADTWNTNNPQQRAKGVALNVED
jgi:hypothetical protein